MSRTIGDIRIGLSGWTYKPWRGAFYPEGLRQRDELRHASGIFRSLEINGTFYGLQRPEIFLRWAEETPADFVFAVKASRYITHILRLKEVLVPVANFIASGVLRLGKKLGPLLWQFPPTFKFEPERMEAFLKLLPPDTETAAALAREHDARLTGRAWTKTDHPRALRHAVEIRHESFRTMGFVDLLRRHDVALVCADTVKWPLLMDLTADFVYCRLHGSEDLYRSAYRPEALDCWAERIKAWTSGKIMKHGNFAGNSLGTPKPRDVFLYFDNTDKLQAPVDAQSLMRRLEM